MSKVNYSVVSVSTARVAYHVRVGVCAGHAEHQLREAVAVHAQKAHVLCLSDAVGPDAGSRGLHHCAHRDLQSLQRVARRG
jgi:hypothetical protein